MAALHSAFLSQRVNSGADQQSEGSSSDAESDSRARRSRCGTAEGRTSGGEVERDETGRRSGAAGIDETLYYYVLPREHWRCLRTNNPLERLLREVRRRTRAVGAFPEGRSALMLAAARLRHVAGSKWGTRRYMDMNRLAQVSEAA